jgi:WD40 repeat protein
VEALGETVVALVWTPAGVLVASGDAAVRLATPADGVVWTRTDLHAGAVLCAVSAPDGGVLTAGDDGRINATSPDGETVEIARPGGWIAALAASPVSGAILAALGKDVALVKAGAGVTFRYDHPATVEAVAFEPNGRRFAAAYYGGATVSWASNPEGHRKPLAWNGVHTNVLWSPDARFVVSALQENALHGWRLQDGRHFQMNGYPAKIRTMAFTADKAFLATGGATDILLWPFTGQDGPMGKQAGAAGDLETPVTALAPHPLRPVIAAGGLDGEVVLAPQGAQSRPILVAEPEGAMVTAIAWSPDGQKLAFADEAGRLGLLDLADALA